MVREREGGRKGGKKRERRRWDESKKKKKKGKCFTEKKFPFHVSQRIQIVYLYENVL